MARLLPKLRITPPTGPLVPGRGFYQLEESSLYVQIGPFLPDNPFFSYLESERVRFDIDKSGRLLFVEIDAGRNSWKVDSKLALPSFSRQADIRWLDFRSEIPDPVIWANQDRTSLHLRFPDAVPHDSFEIAESVVLEVTEDQHLAGLYVADVIDDLAGQEIARFRSELRR
jgi:hypothetical protein